jgi:hypothetical protein
VLLVLVSAQPAAAYKKYPGGRWNDPNIKDNNITVCFGQATSEWIYTYRARIRDQLAADWGAAFGIGSSGVSFTSQGLCGPNPTAELRVRWDRTADSCLDYWGWMQPENNDYWHGWSRATIWLNAECNIDGYLDWDLSDGVHSTKASVYRIVNHEAGHAFGLDHSELNSALMWGSGSTAACSTWGNHQRVTNDDRNGIMSVYSHLNVWTGGTSQWFWCVG